MKKAAYTIALAAALTIIAPPVLHIAVKSFPFSSSEAYAYREGDPRLNKWLGVNTRRVPWCGLYLAKIIRNPPKHAASVMSWRSWGRRTACRPGTVAIFKHRHVGKVTAVRPGCIVVKSGNDGNRVRERCRRPATISHCRVR